MNRIHRVLAAALLAAGRGGGADGAPASLPLAPQRTRRLRLRRERNNQLPCHCEPKRALVGLSKRWAYPGRTS